MFSRLGIGARLFIAFLGISALSLSSGLAGWWILRDISSAQSRISSEALPAISSAQHTAEASARLVAASPALTAARDEASRARQEAELQALAAEIRHSVAETELSSLDRPSLDKLTSKVDALIVNLSVQSRLVKERLQLERSFAERAERSIASATAIVDLAETLVSNASAGASAVVSNLYGLIDDKARHADAYDALDRLIENDIFLLDRMWELRLRASQIGLLVNRLTRAIDRHEVAEIATGFDEHLRVAKRRVASIEDPVRRKQAAGYVGTLESAAGNAPVNSSLFGDRARLIAIAEDLDLVAKRNNALSADLGAVAQDMLSHSQNFAVAASSQAERAVTVGLYVLVLSSLGAIAVSGLIVWLYVERGVVRRLRALAGAMQKLTDGDMSVEVTQDGAPELKALSSAVAAFRDESRQRRALERERERTNEELRRHREELQELVSERTLQLRTEVENHAQARKRAETASRAKSDFLATMSHEIRTPMTGMLGMLRILKDSRLSAEQRKQLVTAAGAGDALLGILNSILDYSKIESGKVSVDPVSFNLAGTLRGVIDLMLPPAAEKQLKLSLSIDGAIALWLSGDAGKLRQIVFNLVSNAIKFTAEGQIEIVAKLIDESQGRQEIIISVRDTGVGIPAAELAHVFESFTQTDASITRRFGGTGLGLSISRGLAEAMLGSLSVESVLGQGSIFSLRLSLPVATAVKSSPSLRGDPAAAMAPLRILIVEDDDATRSIATRFLSDLGHDVQSAQSGFAALDAFPRFRPDLVLMDISLPGMDGIATANALHKLAAPACLRIAAMSAHVFKEEIERYLAAGMDSYVAKPLTPETLAEAIATALKGNSLIGHVDTRALRTDLGLLGSEEMLKILELVEQSLPERFDAMRQSCTAGDADELARLAHAAYSTATAAGFSRLSLVLMEIETLARAGDLTSSVSRLVHCESLYDMAMKQARELIIEPVS